MRRKVGFLLLGLGALVLAWVGVIGWRGDPITSLYTRYEQHALAGRLSHVERDWLLRNPLSPALPRGLATSSRAAGRGGTALARVASAAGRRDARAFARTLGSGDPIGRIVIPRLHLRIIVVEGTSTSDLTSGVGHYNAASGEATSLPGAGGVVALAGHRTTYLHPFRYIDHLRPGDKIYLELPYGTFRYTVYLHKVVASSDWSILRARPFEKLVLSACHPLYSATHRWVVFARLAGAGGPAAA